MAYFMVEDFRAGIDLRRQSIASTAGTMRECINAHVTAGGELEKRKAFSEVLHFSDYGVSNCLGCVFVGREMHVFGNDNANENVFSALDTSNPFLASSIKYIRLQHKNDPNRPVARIVSASVFKGKSYVIAQFTDGKVYHYWGGNRVNFWDSEAANTDSRDSYAFAYKSKMYVGLGSVLYFSGYDSGGLPDATKWGAPGDANPPTGSGFIDLSVQIGAGADITAISSYRDWLVVFCSSAIQLWSMDADPGLNRSGQILKNMTTLSPGSVLSYGDADVFFLAPSGVRSVRSRTVSGIVTSEDMGSPINDYITQLPARSGMSMQDAYRDAVSVINNESGRYWLKIGGYIMVFSRYSSSDIAAWTAYEIPEDVGNINDMASRSMSTYAMGDDGIYLYGGESLDEYDDAEVTVLTPYMSVQSPATVKQLYGVDAGLEGEWGFDIAADPGRPDWFEPLGWYNESTYGLDGQNPVSAMSTHFAIRARTQGGGPRKLANFALHYNLGDAS